MKPTIHVYSGDLRRAIKHGAELWWDGSTPKKRLDQRNGRNGFTRYVNARIEGKMSEVAFSRFLEHRYGIESRVDWRIYGDYETTDDGDLQHIVGDDGDRYKPAVEFDIKKTKPWNQWLAIRSEIYDPHPDDAPFILTKLTLEEDIILDEWKNAGVWAEMGNKLRFNERVEDYVDEHFPLEVELTGIAYKDDFTDHFDKGDRLYDKSSGNEIGPPLRRPNAGIHVSDLRSEKEDWNRVVAEITGDNPITYHSP